MTKRPLSNTIAPPAAADGAPARSSAAPIPVPVVGIGASAGGFDPICEFLVAAPSSSGLAYVVVQHLDPVHKGMLPELLQRVTPMKVTEVTDGMPIEADHVLSLIHI